MAIATVNPATGKAEMIIEPHTPEEVEQRDRRGRRGRRRCSARRAFAQRAEWMRAAADILDDQAEGLGELHHRRDGQADRAVGRRGAQVREGDALLRRQHRGVPRGRPARTTRPRSVRRARGPGTSRSASCSRSCRGTTRSGRSSASLPPRSWRATPDSSSTRPTCRSPRCSSTRCSSERGFPNGSFRALLIGGARGRRRHRRPARQGGHAHRLRAGRPIGGRDRRRPRQEGRPRARRL